MSTKKKKNDNHSLSTIKNKSQKTIRSEIDDVFPVNIDPESLTPEMKDYIIQL